MDNYQSEQDWLKYSGELCQIHFQERLVFKNFKIYIKNKVSKFTCHPTLNMQNYEFNQSMGGNTENYLNSGDQQIPFKSVITTEDIREIVNLLNNKPFNESYTLVSFDELNTLELLELLNKILAMLDSKQNVSIRDETQEQTAIRISEFLKILGYPSQLDLQFQQNLVQGDKKTVYPIIYYCVSRFTTLEKRAYLARFLVPIEIPEEYLVDDDSKGFYQQYKDLMAEFQVNHQQLENVQKDSMNPNDLKKEISQLEQERDQLNAKINIFKTKNTNRPEFQILLETTNLLRREQEEEARLSDKLRQQQAQLEWIDSQLLSSQQRLIDQKKSLQADSSPDQMLQILRNEVKKNRELCHGRLALEVSEKRKKLDSIETLLSEPPVSSNELQNLENQLLIMRRAVQTLEDKLAKENPAGDKLAIYKQQAALVAKKKERQLEDLKKVEEEKNSLEKEIQQKEQEVQKLKGPGYKSKDDFKQYAVNLREKTNKYKKMKEELKDLRTEITVLARTEELLKTKKQELDDQIKQLEKSKGIVGYIEAQQQLEQVSEKKGEIDEQKGKTLEEISKVVIQIEAQLKDKKAKLTPVINELKQLREKFKSVDAIYQKKKSEYDQVVAGLEGEIATLENEVKKLKEEAYKEDTKITLAKYNSYFIDMLNARMLAEAGYQSGSRKLNEEYKSYKEMTESKIKVQEGKIKELKKQREFVKDNYEPSQKQMVLFENLRKLLEIKISVAKNEAPQSSYGKKEENYGTVNRLIVRD